MCCTVPQADVKLGSKTSVYAGTILLVNINPNIQLKLGYFKQEHSSLRPDTLQEVVAIQLVLV